MSASKKYVILQWNCRGYGKKRGNLQQYINHREGEDKPDVVALQEPRRLAKLSGYKSYGEDKGDKTQVTTLVRRNVPVILHDTGITTVAHILLEITSHTKADTRSIFVLNVYTSPTKRQKFASLFRAALDIAKKQTLIIAGDFNAPHPDWGYKLESVKGRNLWVDAHQCGLSLITDPEQPTRRGNFKHQDSTPDLTFTKCTREVTWTNTMEDLGSDHLIIRITTTAGPTKRKGRKCAVTDWDKFRHFFEGHKSNEIQDIGTWTECVKAAAKRATKIIPEEANLTTADSRLLHLWEAKHQLELRLHTQRKNRSLRRRIAQLSRTIEAHANQVTLQQWQDTCDSFDRQPNVPKTWSIIRHLLDPEGNKAAQNNRMSEIVRRNGKDGKDLVDQVRKTYLGNYPRRTPSSYGGAENELLDEDLCTHEVMEAIRNLKVKSAPGPDGITNKMIRNLDFEAVENLTAFLNTSWRNGEIPKQWKTAKVVMIPKPGKKPQLDALRPISLTSCAGKLMEHIILTRLNKHMDDQTLYPHTMVGFRPHLSTQDIMLQLKYQIIEGEGCSKLDTRAILGLDLTKAFDNIKHEAILTSLEQMGVGKRTYAYVQNFLTDRTAQITIGGVTSDDIPLGSRGTPQGSVLSPFLFNATMIGLPKKLNEIEGVKSQYIRRRYYALGGRRQ